MKPKNTNNFKELKVSNLQKNSFEVPKNYFNNIENTVIAKLKAEIIYKNNTSKIPDDYFNIIEDVVLEKITSKKRVISLRNRVAKITIPIAVAASIILAIVLTDNSNTMNFDMLTTSDFENWVEQETINDTELASFFLEEELSVINFEMYPSEDELLNYINENNIKNLIYED